MICVFCAHWVEPPAPFRNPRFILARLAEVFRRCITGGTVIHRHRFRISAPLVLGVLLLVSIAANARAAEFRASSVELSRDAIQHLRTSTHSDLVLPLPSGRSVLLRVTPFELFARDAQITETGARGPRTLRPDITFLKGAGADSTWAAFTVTARGVSGHLQIGRREFEVTPGSARPDGSIVHSVQESSPDPTAGHGFRCGSDDLPTILPDRVFRQTPSLSTSREGLRFTCDLAIDCDYEFYAVQFDQNLERATDHLLATLAALSVLYERDVNVAIRLTYLNFWTTPDDPYVQTERTQRLFEFQSWWATNRANVPRTLAHMITGLDFGGVAFLYVLCNPGYGYGLSSMNGTGSYPNTPNNYDLRVLAHELGHNFGSPHTQSCFWQANGFAPAGALLDSCVSAEGSCYSGQVGMMPPEGGTIMSYCQVQHLDFHPACRSWMRTQAELSCMLADSIQPPRNVIATFEPAAVRLSWDPGGSEGVLRYDVYRSPYPVDAAPSFVGSTSTMSFTDPRAAQPVYYKVRAVRLGDQSGFSVEILVADHVPVVEAPTAVEGTENSPLSFDVAASDPDLEAIQSLTASQLPPRAVFTADPTMTHGRLDWTPACQQAGSYGITFTAAGFASGSATTLVTVLPTDCPPVVTAPGLVQGREGELLFLEVAASDRDEPIFDLTAAPLPAGATFTTSEDLTSGVLIWLPGYSQAGTYPVTFTASNGMQGAATTQIEISNFDRPPVVNAPKTASTIPGLALQIHVTASDPDAEPIGTLDTSGIPPEASFTVGATNTVADLRWLPRVGQEGSYPVTFTATNALSGSTTTRIDVLASADHPPLVTAPALVNGKEGVPLAADIGAADPDGDQVISLASGPLPRGSLFQTNATNTSGTLTWSPDFDQAGSYEVTLSAVSASRATPVSPVLTGITTMVLLIENADRAPGVVAPSDATAAEGAPLSVTVTTGDPDGEPIGSLVADVTSLPLGNDAQFLVGVGNGMGTLSWTPSFADAGDYGLTFTAMNALSGSARTTIHVGNTNRAPTAEAGGPYQGFTEVPLTLDGGGSADSDGDPLTYLWDFGDQAQGVGAFPAHTYFLSGDYTISLTVTDGTLSDQDATTAHIAPAIDANAFVTDPNRTVRLRSAKPTWCALVEPVAPTFDPSSVDPASVVLKFNGSQISAVSEKTSVIGDWDRDGLQEVTACFSKTDLRSLFYDLAAGKHTVSVAIEGRIVDGGRIRASLQVEVVSDGGLLVATITPNPLTPEATLTFATPRAGRVKVSLFDSQGRLVRTILDESTLPAGYHDLRLNGEDAGGRRLPSGVYFYRVETLQEAATGRFAITR